MNWSGGYKHRFRSNTDIRKTAFQQQSRIILVDLVKHDNPEQTSHISKNKEQKILLISPKRDAVSHDDSPIQHFGTPFHNIPCGSSSDTEESGNDELSNTNYSPFSLDQESRAEHHIANMSEGNQGTVPLSCMVDEYFKDSNINEIIFPQQSSQSGLSSFVSSSVECLSPPPNLNRNSFLSTPNLSFLTPVMHRENTVGYSTIDERFSEPGLDHNNFDLSNLPHSTKSTSLTDKIVIQENATFKTPVLTDSRKAPSTTNCSMLDPANVTPAHRKQVYFYSSDHNSTTENRYMNFSERNQVNESSPVGKQYEHSGINAPKNRCILGTSPVGRCSTPTTFNVSQNFSYPTPSLGSSTTEIHHKNFVEFSAVDQRIPGLEVSTVHNLSYSTPKNTDKKNPKVFEKRPIRSQAVNINIPDQANFSVFPAIVTPRRKQVQFAPSVSLQQMKIYVNNTFEEISNLNAPMPSTSGTSFTNGPSMDFLECQTSTSPSCREEQSDVITDGTVSAQHFYCKETICLDQSSGEIVTNDPLSSPVCSQEEITEILENRNKLPAKQKSTIKKRKQCPTPWKTATSFRKKFHGRCVQHCRCRTVIRKIKIRDAETQTSP